MKVSLPMRQIVAVVLLILVSDSSKDHNQASSSDAGETTQFTYDAAGELTQITLPDGSYLKYTFDDAQRLTDIADSLGNTVHYTLDGLENRTGEDTKDPTGTLAQTLSRVIDTLGRMKELHGATAGEVTDYQYDNVGNEQTVTDPLAHATHSTYDALNRLTQTKVLYATISERARAETRSQFSGPLTDCLFKKPVFQVGEMSREAGIPPQTAANLVRQLLAGDQPIIRTLRESAGRRPAIYYFPDLLRVASEG